VAAKKVDLELKAYEAIVKMIVANQVKPGEFLLETELSKKLGLSRTPVREALGRLLAEGLLEKKRKRGCFIPPTTPEDAEKVLEARCLIEGQIAGIAATKATKEQTETLRQVLSKELEVHRNRDKPQYSVINHSFHGGIVKICDNPYLERLWKGIYWRAAIYTFFFDSFYTTPTSEPFSLMTTPQEHKLILDCIEKKDQQGAVNAMTDHLKNSFLYTPVVPL